MPVNQALEQFICYIIKRRGGTDSTEITYRSHIIIFLTFARIENVNEITLELLNRYIDYISLKNYKPKTFKNKIVVLRSFIRFLYSRDYINIRPEALELPRVQSVEVNFLNKTEQVALLSAVLKARDKAILHCMISSGLRVSELVNLKYEDLQNRVIIVRHGKGGKPRVTFINKYTQFLIRKYLESKPVTTYLFTNKSKNKLSRQYVARIVSNYALKAGLTKKVTPHTLRHTFATNLLRAGARIEDVQPIMGHANIATTRSYMHFTNTYLHERYDAFTENY